MRNLGFHSKLILALLLLPPGLMAQKPMISFSSPGNGTLIHLDFQDISATDWRLMLEDPERFTAHGFGVRGSPGDPALPVFNVLVPATETGQIASSAALQTMSTLALEDLELKAVETGHRETEPRHPIEPLHWTGQSSTISAELGELVTMGSEHFLPLRVSPVQLDPEKRILHVPKTLDVFLPGHELPEGEPLTPTGLPRSLVDPADLYPDLGHYLVIINAAWIPWFENWVTWKKRMGYRVTLATLDEVGTTTTSIKSYIEFAYFNWPDPPDYVLLVGDEDQGIPGFYIQNPEGESLVTDHPYACLDGEDSFPEVWVGRFSVETFSQLYTVVAKNLLYESTPFMGDPDWFQRGLMVCTVWSASSPQTTKNWVRRKLLENDFVQVDTVYHPMQNNIGLINAAINSGVSFINYRGLGMYNGWSAPTYTNGDVAGLTNGAKLPIVTSVVCGGGNFAGNVDPCFGEAWFRAGSAVVPKGAVAFFGPSELHTHTQFNNVIDIGIYSGIFDEGIQQLGPALWNGKLELWRNYHDNEYFPFEQTPEFYHHIYNLIGDPGLQIWTTTPREMTVQHPSSLQLNDNHVLISVTDSTGQPIPNAYVALYNEDNHTGQRVGEDGTILLPFQAGVESAVALTVTGHNLLPYLATIPISSEAYPLDLALFQLHGSEGAGAGETLGVDLGLQNGFEPLADVQLTLRAGDSPWIQILDSVHTLGTIETGASLALDNIFDFRVAPEAPHGGEFNLQLGVQSAERSWEWRLPAVIQAPLPVLADLEILSGNALAGDSILVAVDLVNLGGRAIDTLVLDLLPDSMFTTAAASIPCPPLDVDGPVAETPAFWLHLDSQIFPGEQVELAFLCQTGVRRDTLRTILTVGETTRFAPSRADAYGYRVFDDMDLCYTEAPVYDWLEIDPAFGGAGTILPLNDGWEQDDKRTIATLPFPVQYYGQTYEDLTICSNGWIAMGHSPEISFHNRRIPSPLGPDAMLAPCWDDLVTEPGYVVAYASQAEDRYIVEWSRVRSLGSGQQLSFQVIFYSQDLEPTQSGDTEIKFQLREFNDTDSWSNYSTIGIESPGYDTGLQVAYNHVYDPSVGTLRSMQALKFTTDRGTRLPAPSLVLSQTAFHFEQNPWTQTGDSLILGNAGDSPLAFQLSVPEIPAGPPASNPLNGFPVTKVSTEVSGRDLDLRDSGGDEYGYLWQDDTEPEGPVFDWIDISQPEYILPYTGDEDDSSIGPVDLGFTVPFYDAAYDQIYVSTNGTISFLSPDFPYYNLPLPNGEAPPALLAPWWDDLNSDNVANGTLYFYSNGLDTAVVTYDHFPKWGASLYYTFQVVMTAYGEFLFQYQDMEATLYSSTVGIQNAERNMGFTAVYNEVNNLDGGSVIRISRPNGWLAISDWTGILPPGQTRNLHITASSNNLGAGNYSTGLLLTSNSENLPLTELIFDLDVVLGELPWGDIDGNYHLTVGDVVTLIEHIVGLEELDADAMERADLYVDGSIDIVDVVALLELIFQNL